MGGTCWLAGNDSLLQLNFSSKTKRVRYALKTFTGEEKNNLQSVAFDRKNNHLLIATSSGVTVYDLKNDVAISRYAALSGQGPYSSIERFDQQNNFWFVGKNIGFLQPDRKHVHVIVPELSNSQISRMQLSSLMIIFIDKTGIIWIGTNAHGILKLNPRTLAFHPFV